MEPPRSDIEFAKMATDTRITLRMIFSSSHAKAKSAMHMINRLIEFLA